MKKVLLGTTLLSTLFLFSSSVNASYLNGNSYAAEATKHATAKKTVRVYKVTTGKYEANNHYTFYGYLHKGSSVKRSSYLMSTGGWVIKSSHKYYHNKRTFFLVAKGNWYYK